MNDKSVIDIQVIAEDLASKTLKIVSDSINGVTNSVNGTGGANQSMSSLTGSFVKANIIVDVLRAGVSRLNQVFQEISPINVTADLEQQRTAITTLTGDVKIADAVIKQVQQDAMKTPFEFSGLVTGEKNLMAAGSSANEARNIILSLGDAVSAVGGNQSTFDRLIANFQQVKSNGRAMTIDIRQFAMAGIPIFDMLSESMGVSKDKIMSMVEEGKVGFNDIVNSFQKASSEGGRFYNAMNNQSSTFNGLLSNIKDTLRVTFSDFISKSGIFDALKSLLTGTLEFISGLSRVSIVVASVVKGIIVWAQAHKNLLSTIVTVIGALGIFIGSIIILPKIFVGVSTAITVVRMALAGLSVQAIVTQASIGLLGLALAGISVLFAKSYADQINFGDQLSNTTDLSKLFGDTATNANNSVASSASKASDAYKDLQKSLQEATDEYETNLSEIIRTTNERISDNKTSLAEEEKAWEESQKKRYDDYVKNTSKIEEENQQRILDLEDTMKKTLQVGSKTYNEDLIRYKKAIEDERKAGELQKAEATKNFEDETAKAQEESQKKTDALRKSIAEDEAMLQKHADDIKAIRYREAEDEITILKNNFLKRTAEIQAQYNKEIGMATTTNDAIEGDWANTWSNMLTQMNTSIGQMKIQFPTIGEVFKQMFSGVTDWVGNRFYEMIIGYASIAKDLVGAIAPDSSLYKKIDSFIKSQGLGTQRKTGSGSSGSWAKGSDSIPYDQMAMVHKGEKIIPAHENPDNPNGSKYNSIQNSGGKGVNITNNFYNTDIDENILAGRLIYQLKTLS